MNSAPELLPCPFCGSDPVRGRTRTLWDAQEGLSELCDADFMRDGFILGADGLRRKAFAGIDLFSHGIPEQLHIERVFGNAIVPELAAKFIQAYRESVT